MRGSGPLAMGLATLAVYISTLFPSAAGGDASEFAFVACDASVPHPPGYPTFAMMAWLSSRAFARLGFAPAYGANFASAAAGAAAAAALYAAVRVTDPNRGPASHAAAALGAGLFAFSRNVWTNSIQSEVFALNNLFVANLLLLLARHARAVARRDVHRARRDAFLGALLCGVAMTNQHTFALVGAPVAVGVVVAGGSVGLHEPRRLALLLLTSILGLAPYAYVVFASGRGDGGTSPPGSWGATHEAAGFATHVTRAEYGPFRLYSGADRGDHRAALGTYRYAMNLWTETGGLAAPLMAAAAAAAMGTGTGTGMGMGKSSTPPGGIRRAWVAYLAYTLGFQRMANLPIERDLYLEVAARFWMQSDVIAGFLMGVGCSHLARVSGAVKDEGDASTDDAASKDEGDKGSLTNPGAARKGRGRRRRVDVRAAAEDAAASGRLLGPSARTERAALVVSLAVVFARVASNRAAADESENFAFSRFGRETLRPLPRDAKLLVKGDVITNSARYVQRCEGYRRDVQMVDVSMLTYEWFVPTQGPNFPGFAFPGARYHPNEPGGFSMRELLDANFRADPDAPVFLAGGWHEHDPSHEGHYDLEPWGVADRVVRADRVKTFSPRAFHRRALKAAPRVAFHAKLAAVDERDNGYAPGRWERVVVADVHAAYHKIAYEMLTWALESEAARARGAERGDPDAAAKGAKDRAWAYAKCAEIIDARVEAHPRPVPSFYHRNLGICRQRLWRATGDDAHRDAMVAAFRAYVDGARRFPEVRREDGFDAISDIVRAADEGRREGV